MRTLRIFLGLLVLLSVASLPQISVAQPIQTNLYGLDGLFFTTGGQTLKSGDLAIGGSFLFFSDDNSDLQTIPVTFTYGFSDSIELGAAFEILRSVDPSGGPSESGIGDLFLSAKMAVQERTSELPATSVGVRLRLPTADSSVEFNDEMDLGVFLASEMPLGSTLGLINVEYLLVGDNNSENQVNYAFGLRIPYTDTVNFSVELLDQPIVGDILLGGALFDVGETMNFGAAVGLGLNDPAVDMVVEGKITFTF